MYIFKQSFDTNDLYAPIMFPNAIVGAPLAGALLPMGALFRAGVNPAPTGVDIMMIP